MHAAESVPNQSLYRVQSPLSLVLNEGMISSRRAVGRTRACAWIVPGDSLQSSRHCQNDEPRSEQMAYMASKHLGMGKTDCIDWTSTAECILL